MMDPITILLLVLYLPLLVVIIIAAAAAREILHAARATRDSSIHQPFEDTDNEPSNSQVQEL